MKIIDISRPISSQTPIYPGNPRVQFEWMKRFKKDASNLSKLSLGMHTATHLDAPLHYVKNGHAVDRIDLQKCMGWCRVINVTSTLEIGEHEINRIHPKLEEIILFKTKNSGSASKRFDPHFAHLIESGARALVKAGVRAIGIDGPSIRKFHLKPDLVHPMFLRRGIPIYEGLNFQNVTPGRYYFFGLPLRITGAEASPVRAVLIKS